MYVCMHVIYIRIGRFPEQNRIKQKERRSSRFIHGPCMNLLLLLLLLLLPLLVQKLCYFLGTPFLFFSLLLLLVPISFPLLPLH